MTKHLLCCDRSILMRLTLSGETQLDAFFTYLIFFLFLGTASFWVCDSHVDRCQ